MDSLKWSLFFVCFYFKVVQSEASQWTINVPTSVKGLPGSCLVIPCSFDYPEPANKVSKFSGMWLDKTSQLIYHPVKSKIMQSYRNRTELQGDVKQRSCSLKIDSLQESDQGPFHFRIEMENYDNFSYKEKTVSITMISEPSPFDFSMTGEVVEGQKVSASCSMSLDCPISPVITWNHTGHVHFQLQQLQDGKWKATSTLTFHPTSADHNKPLQCTATYNGGQHYDKSKVLKVTHAPVNVKVEYEPDVVEGEAVQLKCSSDAHPPASSYTWHNETGDQVYQGNIFMLPNVSRHHTGPLYCAASNKVGQGKSSPVQLNVLYAPELKTVSSCSTNADMVRCLCIADSKPPSTVQFMLSDRVLPSTKVENHGSVTIGTLQAEMGSYEFVLCLANNTQGKANLSLFLPVNSKIQSLYIIIAIGAGVILMILLTAVGVVKKCRGSPGEAPTSDMGTMKAGKDVAVSQYAVAKRHEKDSDDVHCPRIYADDPVYGNIEDDWDDGTYANV